ncbi:MAG TPA: hypothetical protein VGE52_01515 [Pirellulales bacterium]
MTKRKPVPPTPAPLPRRIVHSLAAVGVEFDVSERTVASWKAKGMPHEGSVYDLDEIAEWREAYYAEAADETGDMAALQKRKLLLDIEKREIEVARARGLVIDVGVIRSALLPWLYTVRALLEQMPDRLAVVHADAASLRATADAAIADVCKVIGEGVADLVKLVEAAEENDVGRGERLEPGEPENDGTA